MATERWENSAIRASATPSTSKRSCSEWRRVRPSHPHPNASVNRSLSTPWCNSERATTLLNRPRLSSVRHLPSETRTGAVGHHDVVVELGVAGPRIPVGERHRDHTLDVFLDHAVGARARVEDLALGVGEDDLDGPAVARIDPRLGVPIGQRPGHRHRFGRGEGEIEPGHRGAESCSPLARSSASIGVTCRAPLGGAGGRRDGCDALCHSPGQDDWCERFG